MQTIKDLPSPSDESDEVDILGLFRTVWRGKWLIAAAMLLTVFLSIFYLYKIAVPLYASTSVIALDTQQQNVVTDIESVLTGMGSDTATLNTEAVVLKSRALVGQLVDQLDLVKDEEFNVALSPPSKFRLRTMVAKVLTLPEIPAPTEESIRNTVVDEVLKAVTITNVRQSLVFEISFKTTSAPKSAQMANTLAQLYIKDQLLAKMTATEEAIKFLSDRAGELQIDLQNAEATLKAFNEETELVSPETLVGLQRQVKELRERIQTATSGQSDARVRLEGLKALLAKGDAEAFAAFAEDPTLSSLITRWKSGALQEAALKPAIDAYVARLETDVTRQDQQVAALLDSEATLAGQISRQSDELVKQQEMIRTVETTRLLYESFQQRLKEANIQRGLQAADSRLLSAAVTRPAVSPRKPLILAIAAAIGAIAGMGFLLTRERLFASFRTSDELRMLTGQTVLGSIPLIPSSGRKDTLGYLRDKPTSVVAEAVRNLRTSILLSDFDNPPKVIMITSSTPAEGKTTVALSLAQNIAGLGKRTILIEGDIRRRVFAEYFDVKTGVTLLDAMNDIENLDATLQNSSIFQKDINVDLLVATKANVNAADLFSSEKFAALMTALRARYDYIIIDTPPVLAVPDARVIGPLVDAIIYVVLWNATTRTQVRQGLEMFSSVGLKIAGVVLSRVDSRQMQRYGYGSQYGYDAYKSKYYDN